MTFLRGFTLALLALSSSFLAVAQSIPSIQDAPVTYTQIDFPGAFGTGVAGINSAGDIVGTYDLTLGGNSHGFLLRNGQFTSLDYPGAVDTIVNGINDSGLIVGTAVLDVPRAHDVGFIYNGQTFTQIAYPGVPFTEGNGINNAGEVVGRTGNLFKELRPFKFSNGSYTRIVPPGQHPSEGAFAINDADEIIGYVYNGNVGYVTFWLQGSTFKFFNPNNATGRGINNDDVVVGTYYPMNLVVGFAWRNGHIMSLNFPGAPGTVAVGISNAGQVAGWFDTNVSGATHGYVTSAITTKDFQP